MNKRWLTISVTLGIAAVLLLVGSFSVMASTAGYDTYKDAWSNNKKATSISNNGKILVTDNGKELLSAEFMAKINREQDTRSMEMTVSNEKEEHTMNVFKQADKIVFKSDESDVYRQSEHEGPWNHRRGKSGPPKAVEKVIDVWTGNMKEFVTIQDAQDGAKNVSLHLSGSEVPTAVNVLGSFVIPKFSNGGPPWRHSQWGPPAFTDLMSNIPKLTDNVKVQQIDLDARINSDNYVEHQTSEIIISGTDEAGVDHRLVISLDFTLSEFNQTVPDTIDLTGKQVEDIERRWGRARWYK